MKSSLRRLQTDRIDIIQLHGIDDEKSLDKAMGQDGSLQTCKQARSKRLVDFIGITGHKPQVLVKAIETGEFDTVLVPLNLVTRQALDDLVSTAKKYDVGVAVMKPLSAKTSNLITCLNQPSLSLVSDEPELEALLGQDKNSRVSSLLRYVLSQDIAVTIPGLRSVSEVEVAAKIGNEFNALIKNEENRFNVELGQSWCRDCRLCMPCPENLNIAAIMRFETLYSAYCLKKWAKKLYSGLGVKAEKCNGCGECEQKCPHNLLTEYLIKKAKSDLTQF